MVVDLINVHEGIWNEEVVRNTFNEQEVQSTLCIPLLPDGLADELRCCIDKSGEYTVLSGYRLLLRGFSGYGNDRYRNLSLILGIVGAKMGCTNEWSRYQALVVPPILSAQSTHAFDYSHSIGAMVIP
ncbi:hypothetical protein Golax_011889 [Gossypium laxum]|uniref:Uncharacterized protein n=1 Tax=Gossypium laxum TaxID=34288 RepID=A0A7J8ZM80_9ROSI|nr:hypothetical protein [Gossypium laxum]